MAIPEQWRFVIQPWKEYPPAVASMRVLNTDEDGHTILFLESMWAFGRRVYAEDEIITIPTVNGRGNTVTVPLGSGSVYGFMQRNQAPTDERFALLTYAVTDPTKHGLNPQTAVSITPADAVQWHKKFLRSMVMDQGDYDSIIHPMIEYLQIATEDAVNTAGYMELESVFPSEIMDDTYEEAEQFVDILSNDQLIRLNYLSTGEGINEVNQNPNYTAIVTGLRSQTIGDLMENIHVDDDDIYAARVSYMEGLAESRYDNWEPRNME